MTKIPRGVAAGAALVMAYHVASRSARDTLFLTACGTTFVPVMISVAAVVGMASALFASAHTARHGPTRLIPLAFLASAALTLAEWLLVLKHPALGAVVFYVHVALFAPILVSGIWSSLMDALDPRTLRATIGRISASATIGGLVGAVVMERIGTWFGVPGVLPALGVVNVACAAITARAGSSRPTREAQPTLAGGWSTLRDQPHLANLAVLVLLASTSAGILEYLFRLHASASTNSATGLLRLFLGFNGLVAVGTFLLQLSFPRVVDSRVWIERTVGSLGAAVTLGAVTACFLPFNWMFGLVRGVESLLHGSLFRGGYELLYAGVPRNRKLAVRTLIDVGCDRMGDLVSQGMVLFVVTLLPVLATQTLLLLAAAVAASSLLLVMRLKSGHGRSLEESLRLSEPAPLARIGALQFATGASGIEERDPDPAPPEFVVKASGPVSHSPSAQPEEPPLAPSEIPAALRRLALDDEAWPAVADALARVVEHHEGLFVDALLDPEEDARLRGRIPAILESCPTPRAVEGLAHGLLDPMSDVRYRCGEALSRLRGRGMAPLGAESAYAAVRWELQQSRLPALDGSRSPRTAGLELFLARRAAASLEHVFHVLALVKPREAVLRAHAGLLEGDPGLRGTALEYLEEMLPPDLFDELEPVLAATRRQPDRP